MNREAFEKTRLVPDDAVFCEEHDGYVHKAYLTTRHPHDEFWCAFQDGYEAAEDTQQARIDELEQWIAAIADDQPHIPDWICHSARIVLAGGAK